MTYDTAVYTIDFSNSTSTAPDYSHITVTGTSETQCETTVKDKNTLQVTIKADTYVMPLLEQELNEALPVSASATCEVK